MACVSRGNDNVIEPRIQVVADAIALYSLVDCRASLALLLFILVSDLLLEQLRAELVYDNLSFPISHKTYAGPVGNLFCLR